MILLLNFICKRFYESGFTLRNTDGAFFPFLEIGWLQCNLLVFILSLWVDFSGLIGLKLGSKYFSDIINNQRRIFLIQTEFFYIIEPSPFYASDDTLCSLYRTSLDIVGT